MKKHFLLLILLYNFMFAQDGTLDTTFNSGTVLSSAGNLKIRTAIYANNDVICVGSFKVNGVEHRIAKFNSAGALVTSYPLIDVFTSLGLGSVESVVIQPDNKIIICGVFTKYGTTSNFSNGNPIRGLIRINTNGSLDQSFAPNLSFLEANNTTGVLMTVRGRKILLDSTGNVYAFYPTLPPPGGEFGSSILKISSTGIVDTAFKNNAPVLLSKKFYDMEFQSNGKIVAVGNFNQNFGGNVYQSILRINTNGSFDTTFSNSTVLRRTDLYSGFTYDGYLEGLEIFNDDAIFISGYFNHINTNPANFNANNYAKLSSNGIYDTTYNSNSDFGTYNYDFSTFDDFNFEILRPIKMQSDQKVLFAVRDLPNGKTKVVRLNSDGTIDSCFYSGIFAYTTYNYGTMIQGLELYQNNTILVAGFFKKFDTNSTNFLGRLKNTVNKLVTNNDVFSTVNTSCVTETTGSVLANDTVNGVSFSSPLTGYVINQVGTTNNNIILNADGTVTIDPGLPVGTYTISYQICEISSCPTCSNIATITINVIPGLPIGGVDYFKYDNNQISLDTKLISIYPNPSSGIFNIQINNQSKKEDNHKLAVYNTLGQLVLEKVINQNNPQIDLSHFENGTYFLKIQMGQEVISKKIVKK